MKSSNKSSLDTRAADTFIKSSRISLFKRWRFHNLKLSLCVEPISNCNPIVTIIFLIIAYLAHPGDLHPSSFLFLWKLQYKDGHYHLHCHHHRHHRHHPISVVTKTTFSAIDRFSRSSLFSAASYLKMIKSFWQFLVLIRMVLVKVKMVIKMKMIKTWQSTSFICLVTPLT